MQFTPALQQVRTTAGTTRARAGQKIPSDLFGWFAPNSPLRGPSLIRFLPFELWMLTNATVGSDGLWMARAHNMALRHGSGKICGSLATVSCYTTRPRRIHRSCSRLRLRTSRQKVHKRSRSVNNST